MTTQFRDPEREDKTSASSFADDFACLGRRNFINSLPPAPPKPENDDEDEDGGDDDFGNAVHKALEDEQYILKLTPEQLETYSAVKAQEAILIEQWTDEFKVEAITYREERLWITDEAFNKLTSAKLDLFLIGPRALIIDTKSLFAPRLPRAYNSWQLKIQAVALWQEYGVTDIRVAYNCPNKFGRTVDVADFKLEDLQRFLADIKSHVLKMEDPAAQRTPGYQCRYCPGATSCPEALSLAVMPTIVANTAAGLSKQEVIEKVQTLGLADLAFIRSRRTLIKNLLDAVDERLRTFPEEELAQYGFKYVEGKDKSKVLGPEMLKALNALVNAGLPEDQLWECLRFDLKALNALACGQRGGTQKAAMEWVKEQLSSFKTPDRGEPILKEI